VVAIVAAVALLATTTLANMRARGIQSGFDFLAQAAGFDIGEPWFGYQSTDAYWKAFAVGAMNTLRVAVTGIVFCTLLGVALGIGRFARNALIRGLCYGYVELFRNVPVLLQLLVWYLALTEFLPPPTEPAVLVHGFFLSKNGLSFPAPHWVAGHGLAIVTMLVGVAAAIGFAIAARRHFERTGRPGRWRWASSGCWSPASAWACCWAARRSNGTCRRWARSRSRAGRLDARIPGGPARAGVLHLRLRGRSGACRHRLGAAGQVEASAALGLSRVRTMRLVVLPQACA
jgi:general L-amino acid transport system permease protein